MWLQALNEMAAETPVLIVGTHAEQVTRFTKFTPKSCRFNFRFVFAVI